jgi:hypothetical protein
VTVGLGARPHRLATEEERLPWCEVICVSTTSLRTPDDVQSNLLASDSLK